MLDNVYKAHSAEIIATLKGFSDIFIRDEKYWIFALFCDGISVTCYNLELSFSDSRTVRKNRDRRYISQIVTIQRAWRDFISNNKLKASPESSSAPTTTIIIDDATDVSPLSGGITTTTHIENPKNKKFSQKSTNIDSKISTIDTGAGLGKPGVGGIDIQAYPLADLTPGQDPHTLDSNLQPELSDHDDESSETESAIAGCAMTLLTPEENQGGGDHTPTGAQRADDDTEEETVEGDDDGTFTGHLPQQPQQPGSSLPAHSVTSNPEVAGSNPASDPEDISPVLPHISAPVPGIRPVLDSQEILSSLDDVRAARASPSRSSLGLGTASADADARSVASSDYSELGGPLKDLERDVAALDRESHRPGCANSNFSYLDDLYQSYDGSRGGGEGFFACGGRVGIDFLEQEDGPLEKKEHETEEEFDKRVRKVNLLSLAQEFAELKKRDAQACPIDHARGVAGRRSGSLVRAGSGSPRNTSLDRTAGYNRRTQSRSPGRFGVSRKGANLNATGSGLSHRPVSKSPGRATCTPGGMSGGGKAADLPRNHEKMLDQNTESEDLPVNEARRRGSSSDLPANMRPGKQKGGVSPGVMRKAVDGGGVGKDEDAAEGDGDFDVYNIESAMPEMSWEMVEKHIQERMRREVSISRIVDKRSPVYSVVWFRFDVWVF
ncbi:hypothetical protein PoB_000040800 [Plakobranchus ocellatus]|uniref:Uncharacterized protein n=1 Tax=Plakobranchus ocellatus TaxID=259542 RepID=A0AAV3XUA6_9GAST|nr:hypothetical protein PoB_000040800 [Plakobranchus ocellatus]